MILCTNCQSQDNRPVFRTNPIGQTPAGWMCEPCINQVQHASVIVPEVRLYVSDLEQLLSINGGRRMEVRRDAEL